MSGLWLASYVLLWVLILGLYLLMVGLLQQIGLLQRQLAQSGVGAKGTSDITVPAPEDDGPPIGANLSEQILETINGSGTLVLANPHDRNETLLIFLSPMCESCQGVVEPLNSLVDDGMFRGNMIVLMKSDEQACRAFLSIFPLHLPVVCDSTREIIKNFDVHNIPFGLLYNAHGTLTRKGVVGDRNELLTLLKDALVSLTE